MGKNNVERVNQTSLVPLAGRIEQLKQLFPEAVNEDGFDLDALGALLGIYHDPKERYRFTWWGKQKAMRSLSQPSYFSLKPAPKESESWDTTKHLFIEGENLEVLKLLHESYFGQVKMIYIDPPYNTGKDYVYPDNYAQPQKRYLRETGQVDDDGDARTSDLDRSGHLHSRWLSMMYPRLDIARQLLRDDGVIFVSIDDNEVHNLRTLMNQVFGQENFVATVIWEKKYSPQNDAKWLSDNHDYILIYARNKERWRPNLLPRTEEANARYTNPDNDRRGRWKSGDLSVKTYSAANDYEIKTPSGRIVRPPVGRCWSVSKQKLSQMLDENRIWFGKNGDNVPSLKQFLSEVKSGITSMTIWGREEVGDNQGARREIRDLFGDTSVFDTPKPTGLIRRMIHLATEANSDDIILDFFAGAASTAHAVLLQNSEDGGNRRFIMVQLQEPMEHPEFANIAEVGKERIRRVIEHIKKEHGTGGDLGFRVFKQDDSPIRQWEDLPHDLTAEDYEKQMQMFIDEPLTAGWTVQDVIADVVLKEARYGLSYQVEKVDEINEQTVHRVIDNERDQHFYICLDDRLSLDAFSSLNLRESDFCIFRDSAADDTIVANLALSGRIICI